MKSDEIRAKYLEFFKERGHVVERSDTIVPSNDPDPPLHERRDGPVQALLHGRGARALSLRHDVAKVPSGRWQGQ